MQMHGYELASPSASKCSVASCVLWDTAQPEDSQEDCVLGWFNNLEVGRLSAFRTAGMADPNSAFSPHIAGGH